MYEYKDLLAEHHQRQYRTRLCSADVAGADHIKTEAATKTKGCACGSIPARFLVSWLLVWSLIFLLTDSEALAQSRWSELLWYIMRMHNTTLPNPRQMQ